MNATDATAVVFGTLISLLLFAGLYVWTALALSAVFRKSGLEPWKAWVPVLNIVVVLQLAGLSPWLVVLAFIPFVNLAFLVVWAIALYRLSVAFGYGAGMTVLGFLAFPVWASVVGWGSARWVGWEDASASHALLGSGVRRTSAEAVPPPLPPFRAPAPLADPAAPVFPAAPPAAAGGFAPPPAYAPPAPVASAPPSQPAATPAAAAASFPAAAPAPAPAPAAAPSPAAPAPAASAPAPAPSAPAPAPAPAPARAADPAPQAYAEEEAFVGRRRGETAMAAGGWTPAPLPGRPVSASPADASEAAAPIVDDPWQGFALDGIDLSAEVTGAVPGAPAPVSAVHAPLGSLPAASVASAASAAPAGARTGYERFVAPEAATTGEDGVTRPPVTRVPAAPPADRVRDPWVPARSPLVDADAFPEASGPVSAIVGAPDAGAPRSARSSVSAFHAKPEIPDEQELLEQTVIARRKRTDWTLVPPVGEPVALSAEVVIVGRRPAGDPDYPHAQLVSIQDGTVSKTHARLELRDDRWYVTDLNSTNGVLFATVMGTEVEAPRGETVEAGDRFLLGDAEVRLRRSDG